MTNSSLMKVFGFENQFSVFLRVAVTGFTV